MLRVSIKPAGPAANNYCLIVENIGDSEIKKASLYWGAALHPGNFGLDDTHMPDDIWLTSPIDVEHLKPGESREFHVEGFGSPDNYDGPEEQEITGQIIYCDGDINNARRIFIPVKMDWGIYRGRIQKAAKIPARELMRAMLPVIGLAAIGAMAICVMATRALP